MTRQSSNDDWLGLGDDHTGDIDLLNGNDDDDDDIFPVRSKQVSPRRRQQPQSSSKIIIYCLKFIHVHYLVKEKI